MLKSPSSSYPLKRHFFIVGHKRGHIQVAQLPRPPQNIHATNTASEGASLCNYHLQTRYVRSRSCPVIVRNRQPVL